VVVCKIVGDLGLKNEGFSQIRFSLGWQDNKVRSVGSNTVALIKDLDVDFLQIWDSVGTEFYCQCRLVK